MGEIQYTFGNSIEEESIRELLKGCGLPHEDIAKHLNHFILAKDGNHLIGAIGLEICGKDGLLRSLVVGSFYRSRGIAKALYNRILGYAHLQGIKTLYLLTTSAIGFFSKLDFTKEERDNVPESIRVTKEFQSLCPSTAVCMTKKIGKEAQYYPKEILLLQPDVPGARMWGLPWEKPCSHISRCSLIAFLRHTIMKVSKLQWFLKGSCFLR